MMTGLFDELSRHGLMAVIGAVIGAIVTWFAARWRRHKERLSILRGDARDTIVIQQHIVTAADGPGGKRVPKTLRIRPLGQSELSRVVPNGHLAGELSRRAFRVTPKDTLISMDGAEGSRPGSYTGRGGVLAKGTQSKAPMVKTAIMIQASLMA